VNPESVRRLLIIRPRFLGDICLTLPLLDAVRRACPVAHVGYVLEAGLAPLLEGDPRVTDVFGVPAHPTARETLELVGRLRAFRPDVAIDCFCNPRTAVWALASGARARVGYAGKGWRSALYTHHSRPRTLSATRFHLASLELRQHSEVHDAALIALHGEAKARPSFTAAAGDRRSNLAAELVPGVTAAEVLATFRAAKAIQRRFGEAACHRYVICFTRCHDDVTHVLDLAEIAADPSIPAAATSGFAAGANWSRKLFVISVGAISFGAA